MRKLICALALLALVPTAFAGALVKAHNTGMDTRNFALAKAQLEARMTALTAEAGTPANTYVGSTFCMACHTEDAATFYDTQHSFALIRPMCTPKWTISWPGWTSTRCHPPWMPSNRTPPISV